MISDKGGLCDTGRSEYSIKPYDHHIGQVAKRLDKGQTEKSKAIY